MEVIFKWEWTRRKVKEIFMAKMKKKYEGKDYEIVTREQLMDMGLFLTKKESEQQQISMGYEREAERRLNKVGLNDRDEAAKRQVREWEKHCQESRLDGIEKERKRKENPPLKMNGMSIISMP